MEEIKMQDSRQEALVLPKRRSQVLVWAGLLIIFTGAIVLAISAYVGWKITHPARRAVDTTPAAWGLSYSDISFTSRTDGLKLKGWLIAAPANRQTVIFAHGYGRNRLQDDVPLLPIVQVLVNKGCNVLLFDFRSSGESEGNLSSVGEYEVYDLLGAVDFVRARPDLNQTVTLFGFSMGAAVAIMAGAQEPSVAAVVSDSSFADLKTYLKANLAVWTNLPPVPFNQTVLFITPLLTGLDIEKVSPVKEVKNLGGRPLLLIHGEADTDVPIENSELLRQEYLRAQFLRVPGAKHVRAFQTDGERYIKEIVSFLEKV